MNKAELLKKAEKLIEESDYGDIHNNHIIYFNRNGINCRLVINSGYRFLFWFHPYMTIRDDDQKMIIVSHKITRKEYERFCDLINNRKRTIENKRLVEVFPDAGRNKKLTDLI